LHQATEILEQYWGYRFFKGLQLDIIKKVINKEDVLAVLPTGGGKSICFQIPAMMCSGLCIVISPLIALMKDQVLNLTQRNISAVAIYSGLSNKEVDEILYQCSKGEYKFLYLSPERLQSKIFKSYVSILPINLIAVDEAHCISQWGYDFRPSYLLVNSIREAKPNVPIIALTASATKLVKQDIAEKLQLKNHHLFQQSFDKPNVSYSSFSVDSKINKVYEILEKVPGSSIIYCKNRRLTSYVNELLNLKNISSTFYHAGLTQQQRNERQNSWINNEVRVVVCTNAFGMGIDKPNVRTVIHYDIPDCVENYYQEAGRAGRDGKRAFAVLLYNNDDLNALKFSVQQKFPGLSIIKQVYQCLANYLQIPVGLGKDDCYDFDVINFCKVFKLEVQLALNVLKTLEYEGHFMLTESVYVPSKVQVVASKSSIEYFSKTYPTIENTLKGLLRSYQGILDSQVKINEKRLAKATQQSYEKIDKDLLYLNQLRAITYTPQKETPQIIFNLNRAEVNSLYINQENYLKRKFQYENRIEAIIYFATNNSDCKSVLISNYFDVGNAKKCGSCIACLNKKRKTLSKQQFDTIKKEIELEITNHSSPTTNDLLKKLKGFKEENFWKVIQFLEDENKITISKEGYIKLLKT
jgi:ATP-dependent DNA helicase RecQ